MQKKKEGKSLQEIMEEGAMRLGTSFSNSSTASSTVVPPIADVSSTEPVVQEQNEQDASSDQGSEGEEMGFGLFDDEDSDKKKG